MPEIVGLGDCGLCHTPIATGTPIWTAIIYGQPKVCHKDCKEPSSPPLTDTGAVGAPDFSKPATGAAPPPPMWMRNTPAPVPPISDPPIREGKDRERYEVLTAALQASPNHSLLIVGGPTDMSGVLASDVLDWLAQNGWSLRRNPRKKS